MTPSFLLCSVYAGPFGTQQTQRTATVRTRKILTVPAIYHAPAGSSIVANPFFPQNQNRQRQTL